MESPEFQLPEGYDLMKEPPYRWRLGRADGQGPMSGRGYVIAVLKDGDGGRIPIKSSQFCDHVSTVCTGGGAGGDEKPCVEVWQYDYSFLWSRTQGGRRMIRRLGIKADKNQNPDHPANVYERMADEARYARLAAERSADNQAIQEKMKD